MEKPTVYLDTNIISAYWYQGDDVAGAARRVHTREWWAVERRHFVIYLSIITINELRAGSFQMQSECLKMARGFPRWPMSGRVKRLLDALIKSRLVPATKPGDALQMAVATAHEMDYLLTWNYAHLANPIAQKRLEAICRSHNLRAPILASPETIPQVRFGQATRRRHGQ